MEPGPKDIMSSTFQGIDKQKQDLILVRITNSSASERVTTFGLGMRLNKLNDLVFEHITILRNLTFSHSSIIGIVLHVGNENNSLGGLFSERRITRVTRLDK